MQYQSSTGRGRCSPGAVAEVKGREAGSLLESHRAGEDRGVCNYDTKVSIFPFNFSFFESFSPVSCRCPPSDMREANDVLTVYSLFVADSIIGQRAAMST